MPADLWIPTATPILESVFVTHANDATDVYDIAGTQGNGWFWSDLSYAELAEWTDEIAAIGFDASLGLI